MCLSNFTYVKGKGAGKGEAFDPSKAARRNDSLEMGSLGAESPFLKMMAPGTLESHGETSPLQ